MQLSRYRVARSGLHEGNDRKYGINLLKETQEVTSIELYKIGKSLPKRILI